MTAQLNARGDVAVLVPAAGAGLRLGPGGPKALRLLDGEPLLVHAIRRVAAAPSVRLIVVAAPAAEVVRDLWRRERERGLSAGEKRMLAKARDILVGEVALAEKSTKDEAEVLLDKVLTEA